jgi:uncharacterized protein
VQPVLLDEMKAVMPQKQIENIFFKKHLRTIPSDLVDSAIHRHNQQIELLIDCTTCGNCCKQLEPGLDDEEIAILANEKSMPTQSFRNEYVAFDGQSLFLKTKPCLFLKDCKCTIYANRPKACAGFPHLDGVQMKYKRSLWENYALCPIVFNVLEKLKQEFNFKYGG